MTSLNHNFYISERQISLRDALDSPGKTGGGILGVDRKAGPRGERHQIVDRHHPMCEGSRGTRRRCAAWRRPRRVKDKNGEMIDVMHIKVANKLLERAASLKDRP